MRDIIELRRRELRQLSTNGAKPGETSRCRRRIDDTFRAQAAVRPDCRFVAGGSAWATTVRSAEFAGCAILNFSSGS